LRLTIVSFVPARKPAEIFARFDEALFRALAPPFPRMEVLRFDGCRLHEETHVDLFFFGRRHWESVNTEFFGSEREIFFVDEGRVLPFGMKRWRHTHRVTSVAGGSQIRDEIEYDFGNWLLNALWWLPFYLQFGTRPAKYKRYFAEK